jgi:hypothetical protein
MNITGNKKTDIPFSSNNIRLNIKQWIIAAIACIAVIIFLPGLWEKVEKSEPETDYRLPYQLSNDYWQYERYAGLACSKYKTLILGDSVIWGHYVKKNQTLSHYLNELTNSNDFANLGVDGMHPAALEGLLRYYGKDIVNKNVILHLNLLWMSSPVSDLQSDKELHFNHPKLVRQFSPKIPCYKASFSARLGIVLERPIAFTNLISHINITYFHNMNIPAWSMDNPYKNPISNIDFKLPDSDPPDSNSVSRTENSVAEFQWVQAQTSLQWKFFKNSVRLLQNRGNKILVIIGPFNENMLSGENLDNYLELKKETEQWFEKNNITYCAPAALSAGLYNDASHPTGEGYRILAEELLKDGKFTDHIDKP